MLKKTITYDDLDEKEVTEEFYFNLSKPELVDMEVEYTQGFQAMIEQIINTNDRKALVDQFKKLVLMTYGVKSDDGKRFIKSDELREQFSQTPAYEALFMELATNENAAVEFLTGVLPRDLRGEVGKAVAPAPTPPTPPLPPVQASGV